MARETSDYVSSDAVGYEMDITIDRKRDCIYCTSNVSPEASRELTVKPVGQTA